MGYSGFLTMRVMVGIILAIGALWGVSALSERFGGNQPSRTEKTEIHESLPLSDHGDSGFGDTDMGRLKDEEPLEDDAFPFDDESQDKDDAFPFADESPDMHEVETDSHREDTESGPQKGHEDIAGHDELAGDNIPRDHGVSSEHTEAPEKALSHSPETTHEPKAVGVHFVEATMTALDHELNERFWGWRRNDLIRFTDNVENMQLGILEVVRRTCVVLTERISRHGVSASIDHNLENSMNWLMIKPSRYWLPSAEEKYGDSLKELKTYGQKLEKGEASFFVRADNLIPLLLSFADLVGSCDENLVKSIEDDGSPVSWFKTDDYFYYSKGVAKAMGKILHAVRDDFSSVLEARQGVDLLNRAMHACHIAAELDPWVVTDSALDGILANHRANMAAEISHLRYFLNALATALAT